MKSILLMGMLALAAGPNPTTIPETDKNTVCDKAFAAAVSFEKLLNAVDEYDQNARGMPGKESVQNAQGMPSQNAQGYTGCQRHHVEGTDGFSVLACPVPDGTTMYTNTRKTLTKKELKAAEKRAIERQRIIDKSAKLARKNRHRLELMRQELRQVCEEHIPKCIEAGKTYVDFLTLEKDKIEIKVYKFPGEMTKVFNLRGMIIESNKKLKFLQDTKDEACPRMAQTLGMQIR